MAAPVGHSDNGIGHANTSKHRSSQLYIKYMYDYDSQAVRSHRTSITSVRVRLGRGAMTWTRFDDATTLRMTISLVLRSSRTYRECRLPPPPLLPLGSDSWNGNKWKRIAQIHDVRNLFSGFIITILDHCEQMEDSRLRNLRWLGQDTRNDEKTHILWM